MLASLPMLLVAGSSSVRVRTVLRRADAILVFLPALSMVMFDSTRLTVLSKIRALGIVGPLPTNPFARLRNCEISVSNRKQSVVEVALLGSVSTPNTTAQAVA
jgi:hypothetical protein